MRIQPVPWFTICSIRPLRSASSWLITPRNSSGASIATRSIGSCSLPSIVRVTTCGLPDRELEPLAAHHLHQDRELELAAALHLPRLGALGVEHADRDVADQLLVQAAAQQPRGHLVAVLPRQRRRC